MDLKGKKLLVLGGKPIGSYEIVQYAKSQGVYTIVADYLPKEKSIAKQIADETWDVSTADVDIISKLVREGKIDGIYSGVHEFNIERMIEICEKENKPCFCSLEQWKTLNDKSKFKQLCRDNGIPVAKEYDSRDPMILERMNDNDFPVVVKPIDGSGSRGFSICNDGEELREGIEKAKAHSGSNGVLIEQYMNYKDSAIINYTIVNGNVYFSGISDKKSKKVFETGAPVMAVQYYPSKYMKEYLQDIDEKAKKMFSSFGLKNGVIWIEAFCDNGTFTFNEMGYRFGGSLTYFPVKKLYGIDQLDLQLEYALNGKNIFERKNYTLKENGVYIILPVHVKPGTIFKVMGFEELETKPEIEKIVYVHHIGDKIENWGSAQQVFAYLHFYCDNMEQAKKMLGNVINDLSVCDENGENMLFYLYEENL